MVQISNRAERIGKMVNITNPPLNEGLQGVLAAMLAKGSFDQQLLATLLGILHQRKQTDFSIDTNTFKGLLFQREKLLEDAGIEYERREYSEAIESKFLNDLAIIGFFVCNPRADGRNLEVVHPDLLAEFELDFVR